ncbi:hypothetical protein SAMN04488074_109197 [Lentzea albidocapillata subsp. violacea]|uniref:Uncharacterized protein n=1 Tax=Lentzea albidocapillata subsp. violacea TaxID=128104 RepID=A0A1G9HX29_9PSEU|nr:hypothetical protein [Lentzea albidocapillata]SDL17530.1 hypothetical protein SAMN04488074_109197 [Lentzea albidocapillata subsp. violacea]
MTAVRTAVIAAFALVLVLLGAHAWRRVGEIEELIRAAEEELAHRD